jgi:hypothetical protein
VDLNLQEQWLALPYSYPGCSRSHSLADWVQEGFAAGTWSRGSSFQSLSLAAVVTLIYLGVPCAVHGSPIAANPQSRSIGIDMAINFGQGTPEAPSKGYKLYITALVMVLVASCFVLARFVTRISRKKTGLDDYLILVALVWESVFFHKPFCAGRRYDKLLT